VKTLGAEAKPKQRTNLFLVPKKDGTLRPVINLKKLNLYVEYQHFKQEHLAVALDLIQKDDFLTSIDLTDAYFSLSIHDDQIFSYLFCNQDHLISAP
jgi:hypothetical protein